MEWYQNMELNKDDYKQVSYYDTNSKQVIKYYNIESGFDIETTSQIYNNEKCAYMYIWMFGIGETVYYGRTWGQFGEFMQMLINQLELNLYNRLIIYVHNLGYEFQFIRKFFDWENVFSVEERKPIKALIKQGIEFKDSYILSGFSLANLAKNLTKHKINKLVGDLDYSLIRNSKTTLTDEEMGYCENDILIILYYINEQIQLYDNNITKIPLTNTGRVRKFVKDKCYYSNKNHNKTSKGKYKRYKELMKELTLSLDEYTMLKRCFMGGFTHASLNYVGKTLKDVTSIDFTSSYPSVMLAEKYPMSKPIKVDLRKENFEDLVKNDDVGLMFDIKIKGLHSKLTYESYLSESKCFSQTNAVVNNGRIYQADEIITTITDIDYRILKQCYSWDSVEVANCYKFYMQYLPKPILESILELYQNKTTLKNVEGFEVEYLLSKGMLNSVYGMTVTDIVRELIEYVEEWNIVKPTKEDIEKQIETYNNSTNRFLYYPWGVWVTAYARLNLWSGILNIGEDYIYSDTDSIKLLNYDKHKKYIEWYNQDLFEKLKKMCNFRKIDFELMKPKTKEGIEKMIGVWDYDGHYTHFKTLGAKRYLVRYDDGNMALTVAGLSKKNGLEYMKKVCNNDYEKVFNMFDNELYIPSEETGKNTHTYIDDEMKIQSIDYQGNVEDIYIPSSIHLGKCEFTLSISKQYNKFLRDLKDGYLFKNRKGV
jgi:hypothetical protein